MKNKTTLLFKEALENLKQFEKVTSNELDSSALLQIREVIKLLELGLKEDEDSAKWDEILLKLLDAADRLVKSEAFMSIISKILE